MNKQKYFSLNIFVMIIMMQSFFGSLPTLILLGSDFHASESVALRWIAFCTIFLPFFALTKVIHF